MKILRMIMAGSLIFGQVGFPLSEVFAQSKKSNAKFLQELQAPIEESGPIVKTPPKKSKRVQRQRTPGKSLESIRVGGNRVKEAPMYEAAEAVSLLDKKIGPIRLKRAPLSTFLDVISAQSKVNFIISQGIETKKITVFLRRTTVREALELLLRVKGLTYQRIGKSDTYVVSKRRSTAPVLITKIYTLNYIPLIPIGSAKDDMSAITSADVSVATGGGGDEGRGAEGEKKSGDEESAISIINIIRSVLSKKYGKLATDPRTNTLIITDIPEVFPQVEQIISELDIKAPQILIEAQVVEINTDRLNELGIEWGGARGEMAYFAGPARLTDYGLRPGFYSGDEWANFFPKVFDVESEGDGEGGGGEIDPIFASGSRSPEGVFYGIFSLAQLQAIFRALISRGEARYLGKPKIVSMNNKTAIIHISRDAAVGTASVVTSGEGGDSSSLERRRVGLILTVTPQVNKEGYVTLIVQTSYSDITPSAISLQGQTVFDPTTRGASTMVRVKNGQTVVIGGMLSSTETKTVKKVPLLGYIPIIGWLFTSVSSRRTNTDLVIFVTPTILVD
ncbi:MAG: secretin N-terminal domain-containing protein [Elusimicrobiota bacterium]|nr:secretin N-terminal domain-containing protein [Elusimicrobiota bacterium]